MIAALGAANWIELAAGVIALLVILSELWRIVNIVQQGQVGVVKRLGENRRTREPGLGIVAPFIDGRQ